MNAPTKPTADGFMCVCFRDIFDLASYPTFVRRVKRRIRFDLLRPIGVA